MYQNTTLRFGMSKKFGNKVNKLVVLGVESGTTSSSAHSANYRHVLFIYVPMIVFPR